MPPPTTRLLAAAASAARGAASRSCSAATPRLHAVLEPLPGAGDAGVFSLTLNRPDARNAIGVWEGGRAAEKEGRAGVASPPPTPPLSAPSGRQMLAELREALHRLRLEAGSRALLLRSASPEAFCAGADLRERASMTRQETAEFVAELRATMDEVAVRREGGGGEGGAVGAFGAAPPPPPSPPPQALPMPTIAVVDGYALGGGAELALAADLRVVGAGAVFAFPEARLGIIPG